LLLHRLLLLQSQYLLNQHHQYLHFEFHYHHPQFHLNLVFQVQHHLRLHLLLLLKNLL
jgi:hypothetical protein